MNKIEDIAEKALEVIIEDITDHVFGVIQGDYELMQQYIQQVVENDRDTVNRTIGNKRGHGNTGIGIKGVKRGQSKIKYGLNSTR